MGQIWQNQSFLGEETPQLTPNLLSGKIGHPSCENPNEAPDQLLKRRLSKLSTHSVSKPNLKKNEFVLLSTATFLQTFLIFLSRCARLKSFQKFFRNLMANNFLRSFWPHVYIAILCTHSNSLKILYHSVLKGL